MTVTAFPMTERTTASNWTAGALFQIFREGSPLTRAGIGARTGLARSTVGLRLEELRAASLIRFESPGPSTGGRPPGALGMNVTARVVAGMDVGARHLTVGLADLTGTLIAKATRPEPIACDPEATLHEGVAMLEGLLAEISRPLGDVLAMGVGLPGPVEHRSGRPRRPPIMPGWDGFDVAGWLARHAGIRALVDNDVNLMAMGEQAAVWPEVQDLVFVKASTGIGAGIVSGGTLQRGGLGAAGDLGHVAVPGSEAVICTCGNRGCLEAVAGVPALLKQLSGRARTGEELANLVRAHDPEATAVVREAGRSVGAVLATVASLLNPSVIVFGGRLTDTGEPFLAGIREVVYRRATPLATERLLIVASELTRFAGVTGATRLALTEALSPASIDRLLESLD